LNKLSHVSIPPRERATTLRAYAEKIRDKIIQIIFCIGKKMWDDHMKGISPSLYGKMEAKNVLRRAPRGAGKQGDQDE